ncbi:MAG: hypothetical protein L6R19_24300 [Alphaproteobacteria bacterium]|nr:hypothetical protein [Alphaproteobacteria bacterium]
MQGNRAILAAVLAAAWPAAADTLPVAPEDRVCTIEKGSVCRANEECKPTATIGREKLPLKFTVSFDDRMVMAATGAGYISSSAASIIARDDGQLILQGIEHGFSWSIVIREHGNVMSTGLSTAEGSFVGYGTCTLVEELRAKAKGG